MLWFIQYAMFCISMISGPVILFTGLQINAEYYDYVPANCTITWCHQESFICIPDLCEKTIIQYTLINTAYSRNITLNDRLGSETCLPLGTIIPCYYHNNDTIQTTLNLRSLEGRYVETSSIVALTIAIIAFLISFTTFIVMCRQDKSTTQSQNSEATPLLNPV
jgi:hypothetical protein